MGIIDRSMALILLSACAILLFACVNEVPWEFNVAVCLSSRATYSAFSF